MYKKTSTKLWNNQKIVTIPGTNGEGKGSRIEGWDKYAKRRATPSELKSFIAEYPENNICMPLGKVNKRIGVDLDLDENNPLHKELFKELCEEFDSPVIKKGQKGKTWIYKFNGEESISFKVVLGGEEFTAIEILSTGTTTDLPPSIHPQTNKPYKYLRKDLADVDYESLPILEEGIEKKIQRIIDKYNEKKEPVNSVISGRNEALKSQVVAGLKKKKEIKKLIKEIINYDEDYHEVPLFSDETEWGKGNNNPQENAEKFIESIRKSLKKISSNSSLSTFSLDELNSWDLKEEEWLVEGLMPVTALSLLGGSPKVGKTSLERDLVKKVIDGGKFLGREVKKGRVLYGAFEDPPFFLKKTMNDLELVNPRNLRFIKQPTKQNQFEELDKLIKEFQPHLVVVDTIEKFARVNDFNDYSQTTKMMTEFKNICLKYETHILLTHHTSKRSGGSKDSILGSTGLNAIPDLIMIMYQNPNSQYRFLNTEQRFHGENIECKKLIFNKEDKSFRIGVSADKVNTNETAKKILKYLQGNPSSSKEDIKRAIGGNTQTFHKAFKKLDEKRLLEKNGKGVRGKPILYSAGKKKTKNQKQS